GINRVMSKYIIDAGHHVFIVLYAPPTAPGRPKEVFAVAGRAARIGVEHGVSLGSEELHLEVEVVAIRTVWSAMNGENQGELLACRVRRHEKPAFHLRAVLTRENDAGCRVEAHVAQKSCIHIREPALAVHQVVDATRVERRNVDFRRMRWVSRSIGDAG